MEDFSGILLAYIIGIITGSGLNAEESIGKRLSWIIVMILIGLGLYYLITLIEGAIK